MKIDKKYIIAVFALFVIGIVAWNFVFKTEQSISSLFKIKNIGEIEKVVIHNGKNDSLVLEKHDTTWFVNGTIEARSESVLVLLQSLEQGEIQSPVSVSDTAREKEFLRKIEKNVGIYRKGKKLKTIYCGRYDSTLRATCLLSSESEKMYFVSVPGIAEDYSKIFTTQTIYWLSAKIFHYRPEEIKEVTVEYPENPENSFQISVSYGDFKLFSYPEHKQIQNIDNKAIADYLTKFSDVKFEYFFTNINSEKRDSLLRITPKYIIKVINKKNVENLLKTYIRKKDNTEQIDPDILNALIYNDKQIITLKYFELDLILKNRNYFIKN